MSRFEAGDVASETVEGTAGAALTLGRAVQRSGSTFIPAGLGEVASGISNSSPGTSGRAFITLSGRCQAEAAEALSPGDAVAPTTGGKMRRVQTGDASCGICLGAAAGDGSIFLMRVDTTGGASSGSSSAGARFFLIDTVQTIYQTSTGNDSTGDGLTALTAYATVARALKDIPNGFLADIIVSAGPQTDATTQNWAISVTPGLKTNGAQPTILILGDNTTPIMTLATTGAGALVAGKYAQVEFTVAAWVGAITDGSHWAKVSPAGLLPTSSMTPLASTSPALRMARTSTAAALLVTINPYTTIFSGTVNVQAPQGCTYLQIMGIRFSGASVNLIGATLNGSRIDNTPTMVDSGVTAASLLGGATFRPVGNRSILNSLVQGTLATDVAPTFNLSGVVFRGGTPNVAGRVTCGMAGTLTAQGRSPSGFHQASKLDFEGTGNGIVLNNGSVLGGGASGGVSFDITGTPLVLDHGARATIGTVVTWTGTGTLPCTVNDGSHLYAPVAGFNVTNASTPGDDVEVGSSGALVIGTFHTDATELARYAG